MSDSKTIIASAMIRTSRGVMTAGDRGGLPADEADRFIRAGAAREPAPEADDETGDAGLDALAYGKLKSRAADVWNREGNPRPEGMGAAELIDYIKKYE